MVSQAEISVSDDVAHRKAFYSVCVCVCVCVRVCARARLKLPMLLDLCSLKVVTSFFLRCELHPFPKVSRIDESFQDLCVQKLARAD